MKRYTYDGSFIGLLTVLAVTEGAWSAIEGIDTGETSRDCLFSSAEPVAAHGEVAEAFFQRVGGRVSPEGGRAIYHAFLSGAEGVEMAVVRYLQLGMRMGRGVVKLLADERVARINRLAHQVRQEAHRMKGFVRFSETETGFFYAAIEPDGNILPLIASHFVERFGDQHWVIHDVRRGMGILYDAGRRQWIILPCAATAPVPGTPSEDLFQAMWRSYFFSGSVEGRTNLKLQRAKVPLKYRRHLVEFAS